MSTGEIHAFYNGQRADQRRGCGHRRRFDFLGRSEPPLLALDADSGKVLWETTLGGSVSVSTITYAVNGKQYVAVMTGDGLMTQGLLNLSPEGKSLPKSQNAVYVFALPEKK